jgi:hypothetical protein
VLLDVDGDRREVAYAQLGPGKVQVEFGRPGKSNTDGEISDDTEGEDA